MTIYTDQQSEAYRYFSRGNHHDKKDKDLAIAIAAVGRESHKQQIDGIKHEFDTHQDDDGISPEQHPHHADAE
jgi:hypothetical protein